MPRCVVQIAKSRLQGRFYVVTYLKSDGSPMTVRFIDEMFETEFTGQAFFMLPAPHMKTG